MADRFELSHATAQRLLRLQDGVIRRQQLQHVGATEADLRRLIRRGELVRAHPGVLVTHNGPLSRREREWVAVLAAWPAALTRVSVLPNPPCDVVHVAVAHGRKLKLPDWVRLHRTTSLEQRSRMERHPPRMRIEHGLIDVMADRVGIGDITSAFSVLAQTLHSRQTTPDRILAVLANRPRVTERHMIEGLIIDIHDGACSVLERGYLHRVERAHALPRAVRQHASKATGRRTYQDLQYPEFGVVIELDGQAYHDSPGAWNDDARRDLAELAVSDAVTVRVTYGLVFSDACQTAAWIGTVLQRRGWTDDVRACSTQCASDVSVAVSM